MLFWRDKRGRKSHPFPKKHRKIKKIFGLIKRAVTGFLDFK